MELEDSYGFVFFVVQIVIDVDGEKEDAEVSLFLKKRVGHVVIDSCNQNIGPLLQLDYVYLQWFCKNKCVCIMV